MEGETAGSAQADKPVFLITGGTGGVGTLLVDWMLDVQQVPPEQLVLLSRPKKAPDGKQPSHPRGVRVIGVDCSDTAAMFASEELKSIQDVAGIFHLAGMLDDGLLMNMTPERFSKVLAPKKAGLTLLHLAKQLGWEPEWLLLFSSTSSLLGYPGQSNYCAANALLDQLATWGGDKTGAGTAVDTPVPVLAVNWGPWAEAGMAQVGTKAYEAAVKDGDIPLSSADALGALMEVLQRQLSSISAAPTQETVRSGKAAGVQYAVCDVQWRKGPWAGMKCVASLEEAQERQRLRQIAGGAHNISSGVADAVSADPQHSDSGPSDESTLQVFLKEYVSGWDEDEGLDALGLDSLDLVQMRNAFIKEFKLQVPLSVFAAPNQTLGELLVKLGTMV
jgi:acyl carrier protein